MTSDDVSEHGYDSEGGPTAVPHDPTADDAERSWGRLASELTNARNVGDLIRTVGRYGWAPPLVCLLLYGGAQGVFEHLSEPFAMSQGYVFAGWQLALIINLLYGLSLVTLSWFLYFGVVGSIAGYLSETTSMETTVFKIGGYLVLLFVPLLAVGAGLVLTIPAPDPIVAGVDPTTDVIETHQAVANSTQMRIVDTLMSIGWIVVGFIMLPVVSELYDISAKASVLAVLPVTLIAVVGAQLI